MKPDAGAAGTSGLGPALEFSALGVTLTLLTAAMARQPAWFRDLGTFQLAYMAAFAVYALAALRLARFAALPRIGLAVFAVAAACRILLAPLPPSLSGDLYRYLWEGRVWLHGGNPYAQPPAAAELAGLRDAAVYPFVNHPGLSTIYPPLAEAGFALVAWLAPTVLAFKIWIALHDLALVAVLLGWAREARGSAAWALLYAWNPLVLVEYSGTGHNDPTAMLGLALAFLWRDRSPVASALALSWGALVKLAPLAALPFLWRRWPWRARLACLALLVPGLAWFASQTRESYSGLVVYWGRWRNNELLFDWAERALGGFGRARALTLALVSGVALFALWRHWRPERAARGVLSAAIVTSPVVHPWYAGWVLLFQPMSVSWGWLLFSLLLVLNYGTGITPGEGRAYHPPLGVRIVEYGLPALLAAALAWRRRTRGDSHPAEAEARNVP